MLRLEDDHTSCSSAHHQQQELSTQYSSRADKGWCVGKSDDDTSSFGWSSSSRNSADNGMQENNLCVRRSIATPNATTSSSSMKFRRYGSALPIFDGSSYRRSNGGSSTCVTPIKAARRRTNSIDDFTIDKLRFDTLTLVGRTEEERLLKQALKDIKSSDVKGKNKQLTLIKGVSGTGKSALARSIESNVNSVGGIYAEGKFDLQLRSVPFSGITEIGNAICGHLYSKHQSLESSEHSSCSSSSGSSSSNSTKVDHKNANDSTEKAAAFVQVQQSLVEELESDLDLLISLIPVLGEIVEVQHQQNIDDDNHTEMSNRNEESSSSIDSRHRFQNAFRRFLRVITKYCCPLVLVLDDLQWADVSSLDLLEVILTDHDNKNLFIIGTYRSHEVDGNHYLTRIIRDLKSRSGANVEFSFQEMEIGNLTLESTRQIIQHVLAQDNDDDDTSEQKGDESNSILRLAELCLKRTHGNAFFLRRFLTLLYDEKLLTFNLGTLLWTWSIKEIEQKTQATANVVDLLTSKLADLPQLLLDAIQIASCLGTHFQAKIFLLVFQGYYGDANDYHGSPLLNAESIHEILDTLVGNGFLESNQIKGKKKFDSEYSFSHDKVREAVSCMISHDELKELYYRVGELLVFKLCEQDLEATLFVAVDLLNEGSNTDTMNSADKIRLADLNRQAGRRAISFPAFEAAVDFARKGISLLPDDADTRWQYHCDLALELYSIGLRAEAYLGHTESVDLYSEEVISRLDIPIEEKLDVYRVWIDNFAYRGNMRKASAVGIDLLAKFGCKFPKTRLGILLKLVKNAMKFKALLRGNTIEQIRTMPVDNDPTRRKLLLILDNLSTILYRDGTKEMASLVTMTMMEWTLKYGPNDYSAVALSTTGIILSGIFGDVHAGFIFAKHGLALGSMLGTHQSRTLLCAHGYAIHRKTPLRESLKPFINGYESGIRSGDTESAGWNMIAFVQLRFITSFSLELAVEDISAYTTQMKDFNRIPCHQHGLFYWEILDNLLGRTETRSMEIGNNRISKETLDSLCEGTRFFRALQNTFQGALYCIYGEHKKCADLSLMHGHDEYVKTSAGWHLSYLEALTKGISCYAAARSTRKRKYRRHANAIHRRVKRWVADGNPNVKHYDILFDAEKAALCGDSEVAIQAYEKVIILSARGGMLLEAGLSSERLADLYLEKGEVDDAKFRLEQAWRYYSSFCAHRKVWLLQDRYKKLLRPKPSEITMHIEEPSRL